MPRGVIDAARDAVGASHGHGPGLADSTRAYSVCRVSAFVGHASSGPLNRESAEFLIASSRVEFGAVCLRGVGAHWRKPESHHEVHRHRLRRQKVKKTNPMYDESAMCMKLKVKTRLKSKIKRRADPAPGPRAGRTCGRAHPHD